MLAVITSAFIAHLTANQSSPLADESGNQPGHSTTAEPVTFSLSPEARLVGGEASRSTQPRLGAPAGWETIFYDGMEGDFPGIKWLIYALNADAYWGDWMCWFGNSSDESAGCAAGGTLAIGCGEDYPDNMVSWMICGPFDLSDPAILDAVVNFEFKLNSEPGDDRFMIGVSPDSIDFWGRDWSGTHEQFYSLDLTDVLGYGSFLGESTVWVGFLFRSNSENSYPEGAQVDDVEILVNRGSCSFDEHEPNDDAAHATPQPREFSIEGYICPKHDEDWFAVAISDSGRYDIELTDLPEDYNIYFYDPDTNLISYSGKYGTLSEHIIYYDFTKIGNYFIRVVARDAAYHISDSYHLTTSWTDANPIPVYDLDDNGVVDRDDLALLRGLFGLAEGETCYCEDADYDNNGIIDFPDVIKWFNHWSGKPGGHWWIAGDFTGSDRSCKNNRYAYPHVAPDYYVGFWDLVAFADNYPPIQGDISVFDLTHDGIINVIDKNVFRANWGFGEKTAAECCLMRTYAAAEDHASGFSADIRSILIGDDDSEELLVSMRCSADQGFKYFTTTIEVADAQIDAIKIEKGEALQASSGDVFFIVDNIDNSKSRKRVTCAIFGDREISGVDIELITVKILLNGNSRARGELCFSSTIIARSIDQYVVLDNSSLALGESVVPNTVVLYQNHPNPFNPTTTMHFGLPGSAYVTLGVYNVKGELVNTLLSKNMDAGTYSIDWDGTNARGEDVSSGIYFYQLIWKEEKATKKMILLR